MSTGSNRLEHCIVEPEQGGSHTEASEPITVKRGLHALERHFTRMILHLSALLASWLTCGKLRTKAILQSQQVRVGATNSHVNVTTSTCKQADTCSRSY